MLGASMLLFGTPLALVSSLRSLAWAPDRTPAAVATALALVESAWLLSAMLR